MMREDDLVAAIRSVIERRHSRSVRFGIGDDAAVWQPSRSHRSVITTDAVVEGVHFRADWMSWREIGIRAMVANVSDIAAMGGRPLLATVALGIPKITGEDHITGNVLELYRGFADVADDAKLTIVGGDITRAPAWTIVITVVGEVRETRLKLRSGAKPGDVIASTGQLGASRAGLEILRGDVDFSNTGVRQDELREEALRAYRTPVARWREGLWLGASANVHAMMDCSDGLSTDLYRMCERSKLGAIVENVPAAPAAITTALAQAKDADEYALAAGEDYELLVAVAPRAFDHLVTRFKQRFGRPLYRIGVFRIERTLVRSTGGKEKPLESSGWDHLV